MSLSEKKIPESVYGSEEMVIGCPSDTSKCENQATCAEERAFVRKIDMMILPIICSINFMQFIDKTTINYAAMFTFQEDLHLVGNQFNILASIFYLGYLVFQLPNNYFLQRVPLAKYIGTIVFMWGAVLFCAGFSQNFSQITALRFLLGLFEAGIYPALILLVSTFYRRKEQVARLGCVWICNGLAMAIGGLISYGIGRMDNLGMAQWRWIMLILGGVTCVVGIFAFFFLIDNPRSKYLRLNAESDILVENRTRDNAVVRTTVIKKDHIIEALKEVRLWAYCFATMLFCLSGGLDFYSAQIIHSFGFSNLQSVLLSIPNGALDIFFIMLSVYLSNKYNQNIYVACAMLCIGNIGSLLIVVIPNPKYKLIGQYLGWAAVSAYVLLLASISNNVSGYTKKIFYNSMMMVSYTIGNFIGPFVMAPEFAPRFVPSLVIYMCANVVGGFLLLIVRWRMAAVNRRRLANPSGTVTQVEDNLTDTQDPNFIYRL